MMERNYKLPKEGGLEPGADPADIIRKFEKIYTNIYENEASGAAYVAREIADCIREKQSIGEMCVLGITTGKSPVGVFRALVELHRSEGLSFRNVVVFSLDEFFPITPEELQSRNYSIHESLLDLVDIAPENIHIPDGTLPQDEVAAFCREYESKIEEYDGIDLMILGTGVQGQIGFNEPGSYTNTRTRLVALGNESRKSAASIFYGIDYVPHKAITMGLGTILGAKRIILIAWGEEKAQVIKDTVEGEKQLIVPATCLQDHPNVEVVVDEGASSQLTRVKTPWLVGRCLWPSRFIRTAVLWLCEQVRKPILKLTYQDYVDNRLGQLLEISGMAYDEINIQVFNDLQHTITGWPGGKPNARRLDPSRAGLPLPQARSDFQSASGRRRDLDGRYVPASDHAGTRRARSLRDIGQHRRARRRRTADDRHGPRMRIRRQIRRSEAHHRRQAQGRTGTFGTEEAQGLDPPRRGQGRLPSHGAERPDQRPFSEPAVL